MEIFKPIKNYEGLYEVSNLGRVKSLERKVNNQYGDVRILKGRKDGKGYLMVALYKEAKYKTCKIHHLVWGAFGDKLRDGMKLQVDHKDENKTNNCIDNLQLLTNRQNTTKYHRTKRDLPTGVYWHKKAKKYTSYIYRENKHKYLGLFSSPREASLIYQKELTEVADAY